LCAALLCLPGCVRGGSRAAVSYFSPQRHQHPDTPSVDESGAKVTANQIDVPLAEHFSGGPGIARLAPQTAEIAEGHADDSMSPLTAIATGTSAGEFDPVEPSATARTGQGFDSAAQTASVNDPDQRIQQLKAALTADAELLESEQVAASQRHPLQLRAEALAGWAQQLFQLGQLNEARRAAQQAVDLSETANLDYLPNEDRPRDLLHRIETALNLRQDAPSPIATLEEQAVLPKVFKPEAAAPPAEPDATADPATPQPIALYTATEFQDESSFATAQVTANRAVESTAVDDEAVPLREFDRDLERPAELVAIVSDAPSDPIPLPTLPPFLGASSEDPATVANRATPAVPVPPELAEPEPFPSIANQQSVATTMPEPEPDHSRPRGVSRAMFESIVTLAGIFCVVGMGLLIRKTRERRRDHPPSATVSSQR